MVVESQDIITTIDQSSSIISTVDQSSSIISIVESGSAAFLGALRDVTISDPQNEDHFVYNSTTEKWENTQDTGASPAGSDTQIQFNDNGAFGADSSLFWDDINSHLVAPVFRTGASINQGFFLYNSASYGLTMGNTSVYNYGDVTSYSLKSTMSSDTGRGWTWGGNGSVPKASLTANGKLELAEALYINQNKDSDAIKINGFDDESGESGEFYVDEYGRFNIASSSQQRFGANGRIALVASGGDIEFTGDTFAFNKYSSSNSQLQLYGLITAAGTRKYAAFQVDDTDDKLHLTREDSNILGFDIDMPLTVNDNFKVSGESSFNDSSGGDHINITVSDSLQGSIGARVDDGMYILPRDDARANRNLILSDWNNKGANHGHSATSPDPTLFGHSSTNPSTDNTQWWSITHDKTNAVFGLGSGDYIFNDGWIGIGTSTPLQPVHLQTSGTSTFTNGVQRGMLFSDSSGPRNVFEDTGETSGNKIMMQRYEGQRLSFNSMNDIGSVFDKENIFVIHRDGDIGINESSPDTLLTLSQYEDSNGIKINGFDDESDVNLMSYIDQYGQGKVRATNGNMVIDSSSTTIIQATSDISIRPSTSEIMVVQATDGGRVGIGTSSPDKLLTLSQKEDSNAVKINGYDDMSGESLSIEIDQYGQAQFISTDTISLTSAEGVDLNANSGNNAIRLRGSNIEIGRYSGVDSPTLQLYGNIAGTKKYIQFQVDDTDDKLHLTREDSNILGFDIDMPVDINDGLDITGVTRMYDELQVDAAAGTDLIIGRGSGLDYFQIVPFFDGGVHLGINNTDGRANQNFILTSTTNVKKDHDHDTLSADPTLIGHSATDPDTDNTQWWSITHDKTDAVFDVGSGDLKLDSDVNITGALDVSSTLRNLNGQIWIDSTGTPQLIFSKSGALNGMLKYDFTRLQAMFALSSDVNRNFLLTDSSNRDRNHDHAASTDPTLIIHSVTDPDTDNTQWLSMTHDKTDAVLSTGTGEFSFGSNINISNSAAKLTVTDDSARVISIDPQNSRILGSGFTSTLQIRNDGQDLSLQQGGSDGMVTIGSGTTSHSLGVSGDLLVSNKLEVNSTAHFDNTSYFNNLLMTTGFIGDSGEQIKLTFTQAGDTTDHKLQFGLSSDNIVLLTTESNYLQDHDHSIKTDPTLIINSATDPDTDNTQWLSMTHDKTNAVFNVGSGLFEFNGSVTIEDATSGSTGALTVNSTSSSSYVPIFNAYAPNLANSQNAQFRVGKGSASNSAGEINFKLDATDSLLKFGIYGNSGIMSLRYTGGVGIGTDDPYTRLHVNGAITQNELSADPSDPAEGSNVTWQSDGTGSGDDGDIMMKITAGGVTKTITVVDFSIA